MAVITYKKYDDIQLSPHLHLNEANCRCNPIRVACGKTLVSEKLVECFEKLRGLIDLPLKTTSIYRCPHRNAITKGANPKSQHMRGCAVDIHWSVALKKKFTEEQIAKLIVQAGFYYHYFRPAKNFFHCHVLDD